MQFNRLRTWPVLLLAAMAVAVACGDGGQEPTATVGTAPTATPTPFGPFTTSAHRFLAVGQSINVSVLGETIEVESLAPAGALTHDEVTGSVTCATGGTGFVRARYRQAGVEKNQVQTIAIVCVDETGDCAGLPSVSLDLEQLAPQPIGEANYLASGEGTLYAICLADGRYRLQQAPELPPLMLRLIDAVGTGPYTLDVTELGLLDGGSYVTYSGEELSPAWISTAAPEIEQLVIDPAGFVFMVEISCSQAPGCIGGTPLVRPGDMLVVNFGLDLAEAVDRVPHEVIRQFMQNNIGFDWIATEAWESEHARWNLLHRLVSVEIMKRLLVSYDHFYGLRENGIKVGYMPYWNTRYRVTSACNPAGPDWEMCVDAEARVDAFEREQIAAWQAEGFELWHFEFLGLNADGTYRPVADSAPSFDAFDGVAVSVEIGAPHVSGDRTAALVEALEALSEEIGDMPVILSANGGPMRFVVEGEACEAELCEPAFSDYYAAYEPIVNAMLAAFAPGQVRGFGVSTFDGGIHFDIRNPVEQYTGFRLDRVGETGFNNPLMNLYLTR